MPIVCQLLKAVIHRAFSRCRQSRLIACPVLRASRHRGQHCRTVAESFSYYLVDGYQLAAMKLFRDGGSWALRVQVLDQGGQPVSPVVPQSAEQLAGLVRTAFANNPLFVDVHTRPLTMGGRLAVFPIFSKAVVQFPNDDIGDWYFNFNDVAAKSFGNVLEGAPSGIILSVSTDK